MNAVEFVNEGYVRRLEVNVPNINNVNQTPAYIDLIIVSGVLLFMFIILVVVVKWAQSWRKLEDAHAGHTGHSREDHYSHTADEFLRDHGYSWDAVLVFKVAGKGAHKELPMRRFTALLQEELNRATSIPNIIRKLKAAKLECSLFYSTAKNKVFCKIRASMDRLLVEAERINYQLQFDPMMLEQVLTRGHLGKWKPIIHKVKKSVLTHISPYDYIYGIFRTNIISCIGTAAPNDTDYVAFGATDYTRGSFLASLRKNKATLETFENHLYKEYGLPDRPGILLRDVDRIKLINSILAAPLGVGGCALNIPHLIEAEKLHDFFVLHDYDRLEKLTALWFVMFQSPWKHGVIDGIRGYFGEKIGMFTLWMQHTIQWLCLASIPGMAAWINIALDGNNPDNASLPYFSAFIALWTTFLLEFWKRRQSTAAMKWGTSDFEAHEQVRLEFEGDIMESPIDPREPTKYFPDHEFYTRAFGSFMLSFGFLTLVVGTLFAMTVLKIYMANILFYGFQVGGVVVPIIQTFLMFIFGTSLLFYQTVLTLTEHEK